MSRIGKKTIVVPEKVNVVISGSEIKVKGPKGELAYKLSPGIKLEQKDKELVVSLQKTGGKQSALWGLTRALVDNMVTGVSTGFKKELEFNGVGYKAAVAGSTLTLNLGYSHKIDFPLPKGITAEVQANKIIIAGFDKDLIGQTAAKIRSLREPEPYKGKGIKYSTEVIIRKAGKAAGKKAE